MNHKTIFILPVIFVLGITISLYLNAYAQEQYAIPSWIKNTAKLWTSGDISDSEFLKAIQWLIDQKILTVSQSNALSSTLPTGFTHTTCIREEFPYNGFIKMMGQYTNGDTPYSAISLKLSITDKKDNVVATGPGMIYNIMAHQTKFFDAEVQYNGTFDSCHIQIDAEG